MEDNVKQAATQEKIDPLMTNNDVMAFLQINKKTLGEYRKNGMPYFKINQRTFRYDANKILEWMNKGHE